MATDNGIDWLLLMNQWWPAIAFFSGSAIGWKWCYHLASQHFRAQEREIFDLRQLNKKLASENQRIIDHTNYLLEEKDGRVS